VRALLCGIALWAQTVQARPTDRDIPKAMQTVAEAVEQGNSGDRVGAVKSLSRVLQREPNNVDARVMRGINHFLLGQYPYAEEDLAYAFDAQRWEVHEVAQTDSVNQVTKTVTYMDLVEQRTVGAAMLIVLCARSERLEEGQALYERAVGTFGVQTELTAAKARMLLAGSDRDEAWSTIRGALAKADPTGFVQSVASEMIATAPEEAPSDLVAQLQEAGQWTARYNEAIGHLRARRYAQCVDSVVSVIADFGATEQVLDVGYPCAARVDLPRAEAWLELRGGPRQADPWSVLEHARTLKTKRRTDESLTLLHKLPTRGDERLAEQREGAAIATLVEQERLDEALRWAQGDALLAEANLAYALIQAERLADAAQLLERVCPGLAGTSGGPSCEKMLGYVSGKD